MPLKLEIYDYMKNRWILVNTLNPGERLGSISDIRESHRRVYLFECLKDDEKSKIYLSRGGVDIANEKLRRVITEGFELIKELKRGESYVTQVKTDISKEERKVRFTHI